VIRTLQDLIAGLPRWGDRRALGLAGDLGVRWWSYRRLATEVERTAGLLAERGIGKGDRVLLRAPSSPEWVAFFLGAAARGAVPVLIDLQHPLELALRVMEREGAALALHDGPDAPADDPRWQSLSALAALRPAWPWETVPVTPDDPAVVVYSSGTLAEPKGVVLTHGNLASQLAPFARWRPLLSLTRARFLVLPPLSHVLGLVVGLALPLSLGLAAVYTPSLRPARWARIIRDFRVAVLVAVPRALELLADLVTQGPGRGGLFWRRGQLFGRVPFRVLLVGGARLPVTLERFWRRSGLLVAQGYGLTETAAFVSIASPFSRRPGTLGRPVGGQEVLLAEDGEILVRGANLGGGGELEVTGEGFLRTGDLGRLDERGRLVFLGRKKEMIVTAEGLNVSPDTVEAALRESPGVRDAAAISRHGGGGEEVHAVLVLAVGASAAEMVARANRALPSGARIAGWTLWPGPELPRTSLGKLRRREIAGRIESPAPAVPPDLTRPVRLADVEAEADRHARLRRLARYLLQGEPDPAEAGLRLVEDLGLSSLDVVELLGMLEDEAPGSSPRALAPASTLAEIRRQVEEPSAAAGPPEGRVPTAGPRWASSAPARLWRGLARGVATRLWSFLAYRVEAHWLTSPDRLPHPFLLAASPHLHWQDAFALYLALPRRLRRRLMAVTNRDFRPLFAPGPGDSLEERLYLAGAYYLILPSLFPFTLLPSFGRTREGLLETARRVDRGWSVLTFPQGLLYWGMPDPDRHDPGIALLSLETGVPILPVALVGNDDLGWRWRWPRRRIEVRFGEPIEPPVGGRPEELAARVQAAFDLLRGADVGMGAAEADAGPPGVLGDAEEERGEGEELGVGGEGEELGITLQGAEALQNGHLPPAAVEASTVEAAAGADARDVIPAGVGEAEPQAR
jgi:long-chain acyl-CoA synthetase